MNILITGASGFIGKNLVAELLVQKHNLYAVGRSKEKITKYFDTKVVPVAWNPNDFFSKQNEQLQDVLEETDAVIHLAGENISSKRWNKKFKKQIYDSRINSTQLLVEKIKLCDKKPKVFISSSAIGYYGIKNEEIVSEDSPSGEDFMACLCVDWEKASKELETLGIRRVIIRTGIVLNKDEGALKKMLPPYKFFIGGPLGTGRQWFPWVHYKDLISIFQFVLETNVSGIFNAVAPDIVTMKEFGKQLGNQINRPSLFPVPKIFLRIFLGEAAEYFTEGVKIKPVRLAGTGFTFKFGSLKGALADLL